MSIPELSVRRPITISMFFIGIALISIIAFGLLPVEMMPNTSFGDITININVRGGIPASEVEKRISQVVEEAVGSVTHLKNILSISKEGNATIILQFEPGINMDFAALEVREKFNRIRNKLPQEIEKPVIAKYEYMDVPIIIIAVTSQLRTPEDLRKIVDERIKERIERIEGVARAEVSGGREGKVLIEIDQHKLEAFSLSINRVVDIINLNNSNLLAGEIKRLKDKYLVRTIGEFQSLAEIEDLAIARTEQGSVIRLKDIAEVKDSYLEPTAFARVNAQPAVSIYIQKESNANTVKISKFVNKEINTLRKTLDKDINITTTSDQAEIIEKAVNQVKTSLYFGAILSTLVLLVFLRNIRTVFIIAVTIPLSVLSTFTMMFFAKLSLNVMSLSGLALGVGMLVDNSIVVIDNIFKKRHELLESNVWKTQGFPEGNTQLEKNIAIDAANEMLLAIVASTLTTLIVFLPLVFINPEIKMLYSGIGLTITFSLLASLLVSLSLVPMLAARIKLKKPIIDTAQLPAKESAFPKNDSQPAIENEPVESILRSSYQNIVSFCVSLRYVIALGAIIALLITLREARKLEKEFIGVAEQNKFTTFIEMPTGTRLEASDKVVSKVERVIAKFPEVKTVTAKVEPWSSKVYVELFPLQKRKISTTEVIDKIRPVTDKFAPAFIYYEEEEEVGTKEIILEIYGYDYEVLKSLAIQLAQRMQTIPKFTDVKIRMREGRPEMRLTIDKKQAALFGLTVEDVALSLHTQMRGLVATRYRGTTEPLVRLKEESFFREGPQASKAEQEVLEKKTNDFRDILSSSRPLGAKEAQEIETIVRLKEKFRRTFEDLRRISIVTPDGEHVYLSQVADFDFDLGPSEIWRKNKARMVQVSGNTGGTPLGTAADKVKKALSDLKLPKDYFWQFGGNYDKMIQNQKELNAALILSLLLVYMLLASLFESFAQPFIILFTVPLAAIGAIIALRITEKPVGTGVLIGSIMLGGIVVNNAIILIDRANALIQKSGGLSALRKNIARQAIIKACGDRLRPILMTSLTTILGLLPMALDKSESSNLWSPLAITVIGGMTVSTALTLIIIPGVFLIFEDLRIGKK
ncbi:MAG: efflux RND transporter permease subunit, partial [Candidatus Omnitrophota bacterium]